jgi:mitogen-activated protein kinase kinase kinase 1
MVKPKLERMRGLKNIEYYPLHHGDSSKLEDKDQVKNAAAAATTSGDVFRAPRRHSWDRETSFRVRCPSDEAGLDDLYSFLGVAGAANLGISASDWKLLKSHHRSPANSLAATGQPSASRTSGQPISPLTPTCTSSEPYGRDFKGFDQPPRSATIDLPRHTQIQLPKAVKGIELPRPHGRLVDVNLGNKQVHRLYGSHWKDSMAQRDAEMVMIAQSAKKISIDLPTRPPAQSGELSASQQDTTSVEASTVTKTKASDGRGGTMPVNGDHFVTQASSNQSRHTSGCLPLHRKHLEECSSEQKCQECTAANEAEETCRYVAEPVAQVSDVLLLPAANSQTQEGAVSEENFVKKPVVPKKLAWSSWRKGQLLGSGSFGTVYEGLGDNGCFFAVKEVSLSEQGKRDECIMQLEQEINLLSKFQHKNIVQYLGTQTEMDKLYIFLEFVSQGSLASVYKRYEMFSDQIRRYTQQILCGLKYLHDHHIVHRDIKCANILVHSSGMVKLADFGLAKEVAKLGGSCVGSAYWMAPEVIDPKKTYNVAADIWSLGCTVLEMATRAPPNGDLEQARVLWKVGHGEAPPIPVDLPSDMIDFISQCLEVNVMKRPTVDALLMHTFVTGMPKLGPPRLVGPAGLSRIAEVEVKSTRAVRSHKAREDENTTSSGSATVVMVQKHVHSKRTIRSAFSMSLHPMNHTEVNINEEKIQPLLWVGVETSMN